MGLARDKDYYRRYGSILRAHTYKPATPWLEEGLFTGPDEAATPPSFRILGSRSVGENRVDVLLAFKVDWGESEGNVTVVRENDRWLVDDYLAMYSNDELNRLSAGYSQCKDGRWVESRRTEGRKRGDRLVAHTSAHNSFRMIATGVFSKFCDGNQNTTTNPPCWQTFRGNKVVQPALADG
jgi:hypothetical protein